MLNDGQFHKLVGSFVPFRNIFHHIITVDAVKTPSPPCLANFTVLHSHVPNQFEFVEIFNCKFVLPENGSFDLQLGLPLMQLRNFMLNILKILLDNLQLLEFTKDVRVVYKWIVSFLYWFLQNFLIESHHFFRAIFCYRSLEFFKRLESSAFKDINFIVSFDS